MVRDIWRRRLIGWQNKTKCDTANRLDISSQKRRTRFKQMIERIGLFNMKQLLYLECYSGISGDMTVAALLDLGVDENVLSRAIKSIKPFVSGFDVEIKRVQKAGIDACDFHVILDKEHENQDHDMDYLHKHVDSKDQDNLQITHHHEGHHHEEHHHEGHHHEGHHHEEHHHEHRGLVEITKIIQKAELTEGARQIALKIFTILAQAEAKAHNRPINEVHFHEVGAVDSIVDIISVAVCLDFLKSKYNIESIVVSKLYEGRGSVRCQHGVLPVPVPAVANILETYQLPVHFMEISGEFVTPTGAAIVAAIRTEEKLPEMFHIVASGIGAGKRNYEKASLLRAMLIEKTEESKDSIYKLESNIDDCTGESLGYVMDKLFEAGARDVYYTPIFMKKNRPAYQLNVICDEQDIACLESIIFQETTTIGIRRAEMKRTTLCRSSKIVQTSFGEIAVKVCDKRVYPEYESLADVCRKKEIPYLVAYNKIFAELNDK